MSGGKDSVQKSMGPPWRSHIAYSIGTPFLSGYSYLSQMHEHTKPQLSCHQQMGSYANEF
jgi:hypothetical protein